MLARSDVPLVAGILIVILLIIIFGLIAFAIIETFRKSLGKPPHDDS